MEEPGKNFPFFKKKIFWIKFYLKKNITILLLKIPSFLSIKVNSFFNKDILPISRNILFKNIHEDFVINLNLISTKIDLKTNILKKYSIFFKNLEKYDLDIIKYNKSYQHKIFTNFIIKKKVINNQNINRVINGQKIFERVDYENKKRLLLNNKDNMTLYCKKFEDLFNFTIKKKTFLCKPHSSDFNIGVLIDENGTVHHFRTGNHRFVIAKYQKVKKIPITIHAISNKYLMKFDSSINSLNFKKNFIKAITAAGVEINQNV